MVDKSIVEEVISEFMMTIFFPNPDCREAKQNHQGVESKINWPIRAGPCFRRCRD